MIYEREVTSFQALMKGLRTLDQDAGIRLSGESAGKNVLVFVTRFGDRYTLMTYSKMKNGAPGKRLRMLEFDSIEGLARALKHVASTPLHAWIY